MPVTRVLPIGYLRRLIVALRPNDQSLFLKPLGEWFHRIMSRQTVEPDSSSRQDQLSDSGQPLSLEPPELGESHHQADAAHDSESYPSPVSRLNSQQVEDVVSSHEGEFR